MDPKKWITALLVSNLALMRSDNEPYDYYAPSLYDKALHNRRKVYEALPPEERHRLVDQVLDDVEEGHVNVYSDKHTLEKYNDYTSYVQSVKRILEDPGIRKTPGMIEEMKKSVDRRKDDLGDVFFGSIGYKPVVTLEDRQEYEAQKKSYEESQGMKDIHEGHSEEQSEYPEAQWPSTATSPSSDIRQAEEKQDEKKVETRSSGGSPIPGKSTFGNIKSYFTDTIVPHLGRHRGKYILGGAALIGIGIYNRKKIGNWISSKRRTKSQEKRRQLKAPEPTQQDGTQDH